MPSVYRRGAQDNKQQICVVAGVWELNCASSTESVALLSRMSPRLATTQSRRLCVADREDHPLRNGGALAAASWVLAWNLPRVWGAVLAVGTDWLAYPSRLTAPRKEECLHPGPAWARRMPGSLRRYGMLLEEQKDLIYASELSAYPHRP